MFDTGFEVIKYELFGEAPRWESLTHNMKCYIQVYARVSYLVYLLELMHADHQNIG